MIFKCPHIKGGGEKAAAHLSNYVKYVSTREGVERIGAPARAQRSGSRGERSHSGTSELTPQGGSEGCEACGDEAALPATEKQARLVERLLREFPSSCGLFEYEDYQAAPTRGNASEFITRAIEDNYGQVAKKEHYVDYIASRPRAQKLGAHGLFSAGDGPLVLSRTAAEVANHPGVVWLPIISLRREDAARLGFDNAERWRKLLRARAPDMAKAMKIPDAQFRWYAAFHDEGHHPHVHMVCYSADGKSGFLTKQGIAKIKSMLAKEIFEQDRIAIYQRQTQRRDDLTRDAGEVMRQLVSEMQTGTLENPRVAQLMLELARRLRKCSGKKQYGYLPPAVKSLVDEVVNELEKDPRVAAAYDLWYREREEVLRTYKDDLPPREPLVRQKEFKRIKNLVIEEAVRLGDFAPPDITPQAEVTAEPEDQPADEPADTGEAVPHTRWTHRYRLAARLMQGDKDGPPDFASAFELLIEEADTGNALAMADLGRMYQDGLGRESDPELAREWYAKALAAFLEAEKSSPNRFTQYRIGWMLLHGVGTERDEAAALPWLEKAAEGGNSFAKYQLGKLLLTGTDAAAKDTERALKLLTECAENGNQYAQYTLGKAYLLGRDLPQDQGQAVRWLKLSAGQGNQYARFFLDRVYGSIFSSTASLLYHMGRVFQEQRQPPAAGMQAAVDSKLRRKIREKKIAMGHKPDDHEDQVMG
ncbi:MAG: relaxase MobL [Oscillospiraceae bacterium]|nr:relaxase MobL [Oscillospiraceae bacterium]